MTAVHTTAPAEPAAVRRPRLRFVVHYLQMLAAMGLGMAALAPLTMAIGSLGVVADSLLMATGMCVGMTAWMLWRRHGLRATLEMDAAMYLSFVVLFPAYWLGALSADGVMLIGHVLMLVAMAALMLWRRSDHVH